MMASPPLIELTLPTISLTSLCSDSSSTAVPVALRTQRMENSTILIHTMYMYTSLIPTSCMYKHIYLLAIA